MAKGKKPDPRKPTDNRTAEAKEALKLAEEIHTAIAEVADWKKEKHAEYFESVEAATKDIAAKVEAAEDATPGQIQALKNMLEGVMKWLD